MRKILALAFALLLIAGNVNAIEVDRYATANTITFNTVSSIVTFNSVVNNILVSNEDTGDSVYVNLTGVGWNSDKTTYTDAVTSLTPAATGQCVIELLPSTSLSLEFAVDKLGFIGKGEGSVSFLVTGDIKQP